MKWWKRGVFSAISLVGGFFSLDCQTLAFGLLTGKGWLGGADGMPGALGQIAGAGMFLAFAAALGGCFYLIRKNASFLPMVQGEEERKRWKGPRMELLLQFCFLVTGLVARFGYLLYIYLPQKFVY